MYNSCFMCFTSAAKMSDEASIRLEHLAEAYERNLGKEHETAEMRLISLDILQKEAGSSPASFTFI
jgi:hypothetical protein